jgi:hypothetical protein
MPDIACAHCPLAHPPEISCADAKDEHIRLLTARENARKARRNEAMARVRGKSNAG